MEAERKMQLERECWIKRVFLWIEKESPAMLHAYEQFTKDYEPGRPREGVIESVVKANDGNGASRPLTTADLSLGRGF